MRNVKFLFSFCCVRLSVCSGTDKIISELYISFTDPLKIPTPTNRMISIFELKYLHSVYMFNIFF